MISATKRSMSSLGVNLKVAKNALRKEIKIKVANISMEEKVRQSEIVRKLVLQMPEYQSANSLSIYLHMTDEIQTEELLKHSLQLKKKVYIPRYYMGGNKMEMVRLLDMDDYKSLPTTKWNIKQPSDDEIREDALDHGLDLMLVPGKFLTNALRYFFLFSLNELSFLGMAFTVDGNRLGRGKGYYDTYLSKAKTKNICPITVALAFEQQILKYVPVDSRDIPIDRVIHA